MELNENRRRARSLLNYLNRVSNLNQNETNSETQDSEEITNLPNFFSAKNMLLKVNEIPLEIKAEIQHNPNTIWEKISEITDILKKICEEKSENEKLQEFENQTGTAQNTSSDPSVKAGQNTSASNRQFLDAMTDFFDNSVPEILKSPFTDSQHKSFDLLCNELGEEKLDFIKNHEGLVEDTIEAFAAALSQRDDSETHKKLADFTKKLQQTITMGELLAPFLPSVKIGMNELFQKKGFAELQKYALLAEKQTEIQELAEMLGRQESDEKEEEKNARDSITHIESKYHPKPSFRGNIVGFTYSDDIGKVVPSEMALLKIPETEILFYHKFAEKQLLSYNYNMNLKGEINDDKRREKGPIIMAIDTSESMTTNFFGNRNATPEKIAKIVAFAITKIALKQKRKCFLISFSSDISVLDLSDFSGPKGITKLTDFLTCSFNGGTDIEPCMKAALDQLEKQNFVNADILVISDFNMFNFEQKTVERIKNQKIKGTKLYSFIINRCGGNENILSLFDEQWKFDGKKEEQKTFIKEMKNKL